MENSFYKFLVLLCCGFWGSLLFIGISSFIFLLVAWLKEIFLPAIGNILI